MITIKLFIIWADQANVVELPQNSTLRQLKDKRNLSDWIFKNLKWEIRELSEDDLLTDGMYISYTPTVTTSEWKVVKKFDGAVKKNEEKNQEDEIKMVKVKVVKQCEKVLYHNTLPSVFTIGDVMKQLSVRWVPTVNWQEIWYNEQISHDMKIVISDPDSTLSDCNCTLLSDCDCQW